jgi:hypothetical protein
MWAIILNSRSFTLRMSIGNGLLKKQQHCFLAALACRNFLPFTHTIYFGIEFACKVRIVIFTRHI